MTNEMICSGLNVIELGTAGAAASIASMVLADNGARVLKIELPGGDRLRNENPSGALVWNRGKESVVLDLSTTDGQLQFRDLAANADIVVEAFSPGTVERWGIEESTLRERNPRLVYCSVTGFGRIGPYAHLKGYEPLVAAKVGMFNRGEFAPRSGPMYFPQPSGSFGAAMQAIAGIASALLVRETTGLGQRVDATLVQGIEPTDYFTAMIAQLARKTGGPSTVDPRASAQMKASRYGLLACSSDGYFIQTSTMLPHQGQALTRAVGLERLLELDQNKQLPMFDSAELAQEWEDAVWVAVRTKTRDEWVEILGNYPDVAFEVAGTSEEGTYHPQIVHNGDIVTVADPAVGPIREIGPLAHFRRTPSIINRSAPRVGEHNGGFVQREQVLEPDPSSVVWPKSALEGITIVDFGYFYAMPYGSAMAALLGARVIKLEDGTGDPHRRSFGFEVASVKTMTGKESISVDLRTDEGREAAQALIAKADAFVLGFRPGVAEKLGLDWETLSKLNPRLFYLHAAGYGVDGPYARRALYAQAAQAVGGSFGRQVGYWSNPKLNVDMSVAELQAVVAPRLGHIVDGDSNAALAVFATLGLGLYEQRRSGKGQFVSMSMIGANGFAYSDDFCTYEGKPKVAVTDDECFGIDALHRVYATATGWVCVVIPTQPEWEAFCKVSAHVSLDDERFATAESRRAHDAELVDALNVVLKERTAAYWEKVLSAVDVGCVEIPSAGQGAFTAFDGGLREAHMTVEAPHPIFGSVVQFGPHVALSKTPGMVRPVGLRGQHNRTLLREVGYDDADLDRLESAGVLTPADQIFTG